MIHGTQETTYQLQEVFSDGSCLHSNRFDVRQDAFGAARVILGKWQDVIAVRILATDWNLREVARLDRN